MLVTVSGQVIRAPVSDVSSIGRGTMGVRVVRLREGDAVASLARISAEDIAKEAALKESADEDAPRHSAPKTAAVEHGEPFDEPEETAAEQGETTEE
jgi:DNA gyrase subunit A